MSESLFVCLCMSVYVCLYVCVCVCVCVCHVKDYKYFVSCICTLLEYLCDFLRLNASVLVDRLCGHLY